MECLAFSSGNNKLLSQMSKICDINFIFRKSTGTKRRKTDKKKIF